MRDKVEQRVGLASSRLAGLCKIVAADQRDRSGDPFLVCLHCGKRPAVEGYYFCRPACRNEFVSEWLDETEPIDE